MIENVSIIFNWWFYFVKYLSFLSMLMHDLWSSIKIFKKNFTSLYDYSTYKNNYGPAVVNLQTNSWITKITFRAFTNVIDLIVNQLSFSVAREKFRSQNCRKIQNLKLFRKLFQYKVWYVSHICCVYTQ